MNHYSSLIEYTLQSVYYTSQMSVWVRNLRNTYTVYSYSSVYVTIYFNNEEDLLAFKLKFLL